MPRDEDAKLAGIEIKSQAAEERAIVDVALGVRAFHFQECKWNQSTQFSENPCLALIISCDLLGHKIRDPQYEFYNDLC